MGFSRVSDSTPQAMARERRTGIVKDDKYLGHCPGKDHPECPERLQVLYSMLEDPDMAGHFQQIPARSATKEELHRVHSTRYIRELEATEGVAHTSLDSDTETCDLSHEAVLLELAGMTETDTAKILAAADREKIKGVLRKAWRVHQRYWRSLAASLEPDIRRRRSPGEWVGDLWDQAAAYLRS